MATLQAYAEAGAKRVFVGAIDWPGWERSGRDEAAAVEAFVAAGPRYRKALGAAGRDLALPATAADVRLAHRHEGGAETDFGIPGKGPPADDEDVDAAALARLSAILRASWRAFDRAARAAQGVALRKGARGGGRDLDKIVEHVLGGEEAYHYKLGGRFRTLPSETPADALGRLQQASLELLASRAAGDPVEMGKRTSPLWTPRYYVRRSAWHALDHAWEIEDRAEPA